LERRRLATPEIWIAFRSRAVNRMRMHGLLLFVLAFGHAAQPAPAPALVSVARIWYAGAHNAFPDLIRWRNRGGARQCSQDQPIRSLILLGSTPLVPLLRF
jgi:hypothetical protein